MVIENFAHQIKYNLGFHKYNEIGNFHQGYYFNLEKDIGNIYLKYTIVEGMSKLTIEFRNDFNFEACINTLFHQITVDYLSIRFEEDSIQLTQESFESILKLHHIRHLEFINLNYSLSEFNFENIDISHIRTLKTDKTSENVFIDVILSFDETCIHHLQHFEGTLDTWNSFKYLLKTEQFKYFDVSIMEEELALDIEAGNFDTLKIKSYVNSNQLFYALHIKTFNKLILKRWRLT